jgi:transglutaminase-like putative cysteine protease
MGYMPGEKEDGAGKDYSRLYLMIIDRYKDYIEQKESLSVAELPTLVTPNNELVVKKVNEIKAEFGNYSYELNFYDASVKAFNFVKNEIESVVLPVQFWLTPEETLTFGVGDEIDKSILLCSMLVALGNPSSKVLMHMKDGKRRTFVYFEFGGAAYMLDNENGINKFKNADELIASLGIGEDTVAYEFNDRMYRDIA